MSNTMGTGADAITVGDTTPAVAKVHGHDIILLTGGRTPGTACLVHVQRAHLREAAVVGITRAVIGCILKRAPGGPRVHHGPRLDARIAIVVGHRVEWHAVAIVTHISAARIGAAFLVTVAANGQSITST